MNRSIPILVVVQFDSPKKILKSNNYPFAKCSVTGVKMQALGFKIVKTGDSMSRYLLSRFLLIHHSSWNFLIHAYLIYIPKVINKQCLHRIKIPLLESLFVKYLEMQSFIRNKNVFTQNRERLSGGMTTPTPPTSLPPPLLT